MKVAVVIPAYNEAERVVGVVKKTMSFADMVFVVDDGSKDGTYQVARGTGAFVLQHAINRGQGAALRTGIEAALRAGATHVVHCDADGQHDPSFIPVLLEPLKLGQADVVFGSRYMGIKSEGMPLLRAMFHRAIKVFNIVVMGIPRSMTDPQSGLRAMTASAARKVEFFQDRMAHCSEILRIVTRSGEVRWCEVSVLVRYTSASLRKGQKIADAFKIVWQLFVGRKL
jgi:glycosyltransferase involved in cell wall biosynthesis